MEGYAKTYALMVDEQLLSLAAEPDSLTEVAHIALFEELSRRGLGENEIRAWQQSSVDAAQVPKEEMATLRCPECHMLQSGTAVTCECGYNFKSRKSEAIEVAIGSWFSRGWSTYKKNPKELIGASLIISLTSIISVLMPPPISLLFTLVLMPPIAIGWYSLSLKLVRGESGNISDIFAGFSIFGRACFTLFLLCLILTAGLFLLVIPGIIWAIKYFPSFFAVMDRSLSAREAIAFSGKITRGHKIKLFTAVLIMTPLFLLAMPFSFGLQVLGTESGDFLLTVGFVPYLVVLLVVSPWMIASYASAYDSLVASWEGGVKET